MSDQLAATTLKGLKPKANGYSVATGRKGLTVSVHPSGFKGFIYRYRIHRGT